MLTRIREFLTRFAAKTNRRIPVAWDRREVHSPFDVPHVIDGLFAVDDDSRQELARLLSDVMRDVGPREWTRLESPCRSPWIRRRDIARLRVLPDEDAVEMLGVASFAANGHVREGALRALDRLGHPRAVPYVLLRLGDWVPQVRKAAAATLHSLLARGVTEQLIEHHDLVDHLRVVDRVDLSGQEFLIRERLQASVSRTALESGLAAERPRTRLFCFRLLEHELPQRVELVERALRDRDPLIRCWLAGKVARGELDVSDTVFRSLLCDRASRVSTSMIRALPAADVPRHRDALFELTMADARPVRAAARFALARVEDTDFAANCRSRLAAAPADAFQPGWIACLGETGGADDFDQFAAALEHARPRVRAAAVAATGRVDPDRAAPLLVHRLADPSGRARRAAVHALSRAARHLWAAAAGVTLATGPERGQAAALTALAAVDGWDAVPALLRGLLSETDSIRHRAWLGLGDWHRRYGTRGWIKPSVACLDAISRSWPRIRERNDIPNAGRAEWMKLKEWIEVLLAEASR